jgi:tripartite-type tricarboxylate transporter receptor subunit TctC
MMGDLVGGQISMAFDATPTALPQIQAGAIIAASAGMAERMRVLPNLPTMQEQGLKGFECYTWNAILAPAGTPPSIVEKLARAIKVALDDPNVIKRLQDAGVDPVLGRGPRETADFISTELAKWAPIIKLSGAVVN